jgi:NTP pyrophosphatase (non-canonical NTP hydrolase)
MEFSEISKRAKEIRQQYNVLNRVEGYKSWGVNDYAEGLVGDVGDLMKLLMAKKGLRFAGGDIDSKLAHELADCLWSVIVIADELDIDLEKEFLKTMRQLENKISDRRVVKKKKEV